MVSAAPLVARDLNCPATDLRAFSPSTRTKNLPPIPQTPRKRKTAGNHRLRGIKRALPPELSTLHSISARLISHLNLSYTPDDWQLHIIQRVLQGYDSILCAGTGYGKSLIFEALAVLGGVGKVVVIISPLKALERDQAEQAVAKGINAIVINEDTEKTAALWKQVRMTAAVVYMSPEMALSDSFAKLWKDVRFRNRLTALAVDEAHCIDDWGADDFRPLYRKLHILRNYTGFEIPFFTCTATARTSTFDLIWSTLAYGNRPFWGLDVGTERPNLFFITQTFSDPKNPLLDILILLPLVLDHSTELADIDKSILYFDSEAACRTAVHFLRKIFPSQLRSCAHAFSSDLSQFKAGDIRTLCATDAAGMGCNIPDIKNVVCFNVPKSTTTVTQRWGRAGRNRTLEGVCMLLVPPWAFEPNEPLQLNPAIQHLQNGTRQQLHAPARDTKVNTLRRAKIAPTLAKFINLKHPECAHKHLCSEFSPKTRLTTYHTLGGTPVPVSSARNADQSTSSTFELTWTVLNLKKCPPPTRCCYICNPDLATKFGCVDPLDRRLRAFAHEFTYPIAILPLRSSSSASTSSNASQGRVGRTALSDGDRATLRQALILWRTSKHRKAGEQAYLSAQVYLPPKQLDSFVKAAEKMLIAREISQQYLRQLVAWDGATESDLSELAEVIEDWRYGISISAGPRTPTSQCRTLKKSRPTATGMTSSREPPPPQPHFERPRHAPSTSSYQLHLPPPVAEPEVFYMPAPRLQQSIALTPPTTTPNHYRPQYPPSVALTPQATTPNHYRSSQPPLLTPARNPYQHLLSTLEHTRLQQLSHLSSNTVFATGNTSI